MAKIYRILGKRGNTTIPYALRVFLGFRPNDLLSFRAESDEVIIRREKICDDCCTSEHRADAPTSSEALRSFLSSLPCQCSEGGPHLFESRDRPVQNLRKVRTKA